MPTQVPAPDEHGAREADDRQPPAEEGQLADAYEVLQRSVGFIAITMPIIVAGGDWVLGDNESLRASISAYYYGTTGSYFVGSLFALAVFFASYEYNPRSHRNWDNKMSNLASLMAIGVALLPTTEGEDAVGGAAVVGALHLVCAGVLFVLLAVFSLYQFTKTRADNERGVTWRDRLTRLFVTVPERRAGMSRSKLRRNTIYRTCGWIIVACIVMIPISNGLHWDSIFWLETIAVIAFGFSWLVKGGTLFADVPAEPPLVTTDVR